MITATKTNKDLNPPAMHIPYSFLPFLCVFIIMSACQGGTHRMYMESNGSQATGHAKEESRIALALSAALVSGHSDTNTQHGNGSLLPASSSNGSPGTLAPTEQSVQVPRPSSAASETKLNEAIVPSQDEKKEEVWQASADHEAWFQRFVDAVDHAEEWDEVAGILAEGRRRGYLDKTVEWDDDQYTPLHYAAEEGNLKVVEELVKKDNIPVDIITDGRGRTPLQFAASAGHLQIVEFFCETRSSNKPYGQTKIQRFTLCRSRL